MTLRIPVTIGCLLMSLTRFAVAQEVGFESAVAFRPLDGINSAPPLSAPPLSAQPASPPLSAPPLSAQPASSPLSAFSPTHLQNRLHNRLNAGSHQSLADLKTLGLSGGISYVQNASTDNGSTSASGFIQTLQTKPGAAFLTSAAVPGSAQLANRSFLRAALYLAMEAATLTIHTTQNAKARTKEASYERYANGNWSVVKYAAWLVDYHDFHELDNPYIEDLRSIVTGVNPAYDISVDWKAIPIDLLRNVERNTLYVYMLSRGANSFSHVMPDYGSQQYYELISKYYQYGPGWSDFNPTLFTLPWNGTAMTSQFYEGRDRAEIFNNHYRTAGNMLTLLIANHMISAFDAYFSVALKQSRVSMTAGADFNQPVNLRWAF